MGFRWQWGLGLALAVLVMTGGDVHAQSEKGSDRLFQSEGTKLQKSNKMWEQSDTCGKDSFRKFPDYTAEAALQRDAYMRDCLRKHHLPPRNDVARPGP